jgi:NADH:ubiquinone oxidoreductase subunit K
MEVLKESASLLVVAALALFWIGMLGLLWRRSLIGMLVGVLFGWLSVTLAAIGFIGFQSDAVGVAGGAALVLCAALVCALQVALGLAIVVARIARRGTLDAQDAGLLEG